MSNSIVRLQRSTFVSYLAATTRAVEYGFIAAGVTVAVLAIIESLVIVVGWIAALQAFAIFANSIGRYIVAA